MYQLEISDDVKFLELADQLHGGLTRDEFFRDWFQRGFAESVGAFQRGTVFPPRRS